MLTPLSSEHESAELIDDWISSYIARPHPQTGRRGSVCPFVAPATANEEIELTALRFGEEQDLEAVKGAIAVALSRYREMIAEAPSELRTLIVVFPDLREENWRLVDEAHLVCKTEAVREGLMLGQFHPSCEAPAAHNPDFAVNRSPVPLIVVRTMSPHDILFLESEPVWMDHYRTTMAQRAVPAERLEAAQSRAGGPREAPRAPYVRYASTDALQEMQSPPSGTSLELSFVLVTQVKELLFRMLHVEIDTARSCLRSDDAAAVCKALERANRVQGVLLSTWEVLNGMSTTDFAGFRDFLGEASGRQSFMYRALEFSLGNKDEASLENLRRYGPLHRILEQEVEAPTLYDEAVSYLHRNVRSLDAALLDRDFRLPREPSDEVEEAWLDVYSEPGRNPAAYALAEALIEVAFRFSQWRATHLLVVERMIGSKPGTGGTEGAEWLRRIADHRFFPELWSVRTRI